MIFFKGVLEADLKPGYIPGTVAVSFKEAYTWYERLMSAKRHGASRHIRHGKAKLIMIEFDESKLKGPECFQQAGVSEHSKECCWTSTLKTKAQLNTSCAYKVIEDNEIDSYLFGRAWK